MTHHSFTTSLELFDQLMKRYELTPPYGLNQRMFELYLNKKIVQVRLRVCNILLKWINTHFEEDFVYNEPLLIKFRQFIDKKAVLDFATLAAQMIGTLDKKLRDDGKSRFVPVFAFEKEKPAPKSILAPRFSLETPLGSFNAVLDIDALEFARQLTLVEFELYALVPAYECLDQIWKSKRKKEALKYRQLLPHESDGSGANITELIKHTNQLGYWVATAILSHESVKSRMLAIKWFIQLAQHCRELNNLTGVTTILAGLQMGPVERLKKTWELLGDKFPRMVDCDFLIDI